MSPEEDRTRDAVDSEPKHYQLSCSGPRSHWYDSIRKEIHAVSGNRTPGVPLSRQTPRPVGQRGGLRLRRDTVVQTKATLKVVRIRVNCVLLYSDIENVTLCSLRWTQVANFISKRTIFCCHMPATVQSTNNYRVQP